MGNLRKAATGTFVAFAIVLGFAGTSHAGPGRVDPLANLAFVDRLMGETGQAELILAGNKSFREQRRDAINKHNPNAAAISQMLGGAKSIDLAGQGMAGVSPRHYAYCFLRYGSYRIRDNSFVDFNGQRAQCSSPYLSGEN